MASMPLRTNWFSAINTLSALRAERFSRTPSKPKAPRKPRADKGTTRRGLPPSAPNGGDTDASTTE